jgi:hypothetical protein
MNIFKYFKKPEEKKITLEEAQECIDPIFVASSLLNFHHEFRDVYSKRTMIDTFTAVGPMQTYLGWLVKTGKITIKETNDTHT